MNVVRWCVTVCCSVLQSVAVCDVIYTRDV